MESKQEAATTTHAGSHYRNIKETYKILDQLGKGSFAFVRKAKHRETGEYFAIKILSKKKMEDKDLEAIQVEIEIMKNIDHPNVVKLYDVYEDEGHICLVMELMQGGELFEKILECDHFPECDAREAIKSIIDALRYCHGMGIIHRDLKPENLLIKDSAADDISSLKISDFGLARFIKTDEYAQTTCGTPGYVAPEIINLKPYSKECDYWSIGVILYILLSGSPPFYEDKDDDLFEKIRKCKWEFDGEEWEEVSNEAKDLI